MVYARDAEQQSMVCLQLGSQSGANRAKWVADGLTCGPGTYLGRSKGEFSPGKSALEVLIWT